MYAIRLTQKVQSELYSHLYPGDNKEAVAIALCGRNCYENDRQLFIYKVIPIPYDQCKVRSKDFIQWSTALLNPHLHEAMKKGLSILKIHSHPTGYRNFSSTDNESDLDFFNSVYGWMDDDFPHASLVMLPDKKMFGRIIKPDLSFSQIDKIAVVGDDLEFDFHDELNRKVNEFSTRTSQALGALTTNILRRLKIGVVGCSGTGSPVIEQLARLGVGGLVLVDPDKVEEKNLNRILNSTMSDAKNKRHKTEVLAKAIEKIGLGTNVVRFNANLYDDVEAIKCLATCDVIFGCVDSVDGRFILNQISSFYIIPYIDLGVKILADGKGGISQICGAIHYLKPGGSSLMGRSVYTSEDVRAAGIFRTNPSEYRKLRKSGYIVNVNVNSPAVISINMQTASMAVNEFLARIHNFRYEPSSNYAIIRFSITDGYTQHEIEGLPDSYLSKFVGRGEIIPLLNMAELK